MKLQISAGLIGALLVSGCSSDPTTRSTQEGAAVGAVAGGVICAFARCSRDTAIAAVGLGAVAGGAIGYSLANNIEQRRKALAGRENDLDARLTQVRGANGDLEKYNARLNEDVRQAEARIDKGQQSAGQLAKEREDLDGRIRTANTQLAAAEKELQDLKQFRARRPTPSRELDAEIDKYERLLAQARSDTQALASVRQRI